MGQISADAFLRKHELSNLLHTIGVWGPTPIDLEASVSARTPKCARTNSIKRWSIHTDGLIDRNEFEPRLERARRRHAELESKLESLRSQTQEQTALREALDCVDSFSEVVSANLDQADWATRREILRTLIDRIILEPTQVRIVYRITFPLFAKSASKDRVLHFCWRSDDRSLRRSDSSFRPFPVFADPGPKPFTNQSKRGFSAIIGQWPGDESDEEVAAALKELS